MCLSSHSSLPGPLVKDNAAADVLMMMATVVNQITQEKLSHDFYHQKAKTLIKRFNLTFFQAKQIVHCCPDCLA